MGKQLSIKNKSFQKEREHLKKQISYQRDMVVEKTVMTRRMPFGAY